MDKPLDKPLSNPPIDIDATVAEFERMQRAADLEFIGASLSGQASSHDRDRHIVELARLMRQTRRAMNITPELDQGLYIDSELFDPSSLTPNLRLVPTQSPSPTLSQDHPPETEPDTETPLHSVFAEAEVRTQPGESPLPDRHFTDEQLQALEDQARAQYELIHGRRSRLPKSMSQLKAELFAELGIEYPLKRIN